MWSQVYNPFGSAVLSTIVAALPIVCLLGLIAFAKMQAHIAAVITLVLSLVIAIFAFGMPSSMALEAAGFGAMTGLFPIGWIIINVIFQ
jgi:lactate permease